MSLIAMAVHDTDENGRTPLTQKTLESLQETVDFTKHRLFVIDNGSCQATKDMLVCFEDIITKLITLPENIGTAQAINLAWRKRKENEHCVKIDNDVVISQKGWADELEYALLLDPTIGQVGLKRKDCWETPWHENPEHRSILYMLPHVAYQKWVIVEKVKHVIGTCVMHNWRLLDKVGYLWQPGLYGYDDVLMSWRSNLAGMYTCFLSWIEIFHIDPGGDEYCDWKQRHSGQYQKDVSNIVDSYLSHKRSIYYE